MWNQVICDDAPDRTEVPATMPARPDRSAPDARSAAPDWALAFANTLPAFAGRGEARRWPRVIP